MERRPKNRVRAVPIFAKLAEVQLHRITTAADRATFRAGDTIVMQGDVGDSMYIIERGRCDVVVNDATVHTLSDGDSFGELSLLSDEARSASVVATSAEVVCMVLSAVLVRPILEQWWGRGELDKRERTLRRVPLFAFLARGELRRLATQLERVQFPDTNVAIITEGDFGEDMFVISQGNCEAFTQEHGRVKEYGPGDFFGELGVVGGSTEPRKATVRTVPSKVGSKTTVECLRLRRNDVVRILSRDVSSVQRAINDSEAEYRRAENLKMSEIVAVPLRKFWDLMVIESASLSRGTMSLAEGQVTREGYEQMHLRVSKSLEVEFNLQDAKNSANQDWAEDITAFSGDTGTSIWLEEVKKKFKEAAGHTVADHSDGWESLFQSFDEDGSGEMEFQEFEAAVRGGCNIEEAVVSSNELRELFDAVDKDGSGDIDLNEFVQFLDSDPLAADMSFKAFSEAMQQLAQLWVGTADESQYANFLSAIYDNITTRDGHLRDVVVTGDSYRLAPLDDIVSMVNPEDHKVHIDGVDINDIHSISGQTPIEVQAARLQAEEHAANSAAEAAKRQAAVDAAVWLKKKKKAEKKKQKAEEVRQMEECQALAAAAAAEGTQAALTEAEMAEIRERQKQQRELRNRQAKRRNGVLRSNAETARDDFRKTKRTREMVGLLINGREKLAPDGTLLNKGEVDPHILDMYEMCLYTRQPIQRSKRKLYSDPVLGVTLRPGRMPELSEDTPLEIQLSPRCQPGNVDMWVGHNVTDLGSTKGPILSLHSKVCEHESSPHLPRLSSLSLDSCTTHHTQHQGTHGSARLREDIHSPRLLKQRSEDVDYSDELRRRLNKYKSSAATGVGNGSAAYREMVEGIREVAQKSKYLNQHPAEIKKQRQRRGKGSILEGSTGLSGSSTERGTASSVRASARADVARIQVHSARQRSRNTHVEQHGFADVDVSQSIKQVRGSAPKRFL